MSSWLRVGFCCFSAFFVSAAFGKEPVLPPSPPLEIKVPSFDVKTLSCGLKVQFLKSNDLPLVQVNLLIPGGNVQDPEGKEGLVGLMNSLLRDGGAGDLSPEAFDEALEGRAASMDAGADAEGFSAGFKCLAKDFPDVLKLFADMLRKPLFDAKRFETAKANALDGLARVEDTPDNLTRVLFYKSLFGGSAYGRWASPKSVQSIAREDVVDFFKDHYGPQGAILSVTGDFDEAKALAQLEGLFAGWKGGVAAATPAEGKPLGPTIYFFPKDVSQVFIRYGVLGIKRHDPSQIPLDVANYILGGSGFSSRLMREIRSNRGLAYFVDSVSMPYNVRGVFEVIGGTRPDTVKEYLDLMFKVMDDFGKEGPTDKEISEAKQSMIEEYAYNFESPYSLAPYKASLDFHGYPTDYLETYRDRIKAVSREQATEAAQAILSQKDWVLVVCGPEALEKDLSAFGKVVTVKSVFDSLEK